MAYHATVPKAKDIKLNTAQSPAVSAAQGTLYLLRKYEYTALYPYANTITAARKTREAL